MTGICHRGKLLCQSRKDRHTPEFTLVRNELRGSPWSSRLWNTKNHDLLDILKTVAPMHATLIFLEIPTNIQPFSSYFKRGVQHHKVPDPALEFLLQHPLVSILSRREGQSHEFPENFLCESGYSDIQKARVHDLIDGYAAGAMFLNFDRHWMGIMNGTDVLDELMDTVVPRFHSLTEEAAEFDKLLLRLGPANILARDIVCRIRYWKYQELCLIQEDLHTHSHMPLEARISLYREEMFMWQRIWWSIPDIKAGEKVHSHLCTLVP